MPAYYVASALHKLQRDIIGLVPLVKGKGRLAKDVSEIMLRLRREAIVEGEVDMIEPGEEAGESLIDAIVLLDREVDTITPFCTQLTYEGLTDEILGIKNGVVTIKLRSGDEEEYASSEDEGEGGNVEENYQVSIIFKRYFVQRNSRFEFWGKRAVSCATARRKCKRIIKL